MEAPFVSFSRAPPAMNAPLKPRTLVNPFPATATPTLEDVALRIATSDLKPTRKRDYLSALHRTSELLHEPLSSLPANPKDLRERLENAGSILTQRSPKTWANLRSNLLAALEIAGLSEVLRTAKILPTPEWNVLAQNLPDRRYRDG